MLHGDMNIVNMNTGSKKCNLFLELIKAKAINAQVGNQLISYKPL